MRRFPLVSTLSLSIALTLPACDPAQRSAPVAASAAPARPEIPTQLPRNVRPLHYSISAQPDAANLRFSASVLIEIEVLEATDTITLNAAELDISSATLDGQARGRVSTEADAQTATFRFDSAIAPGRHRLNVDYAGRINTQAAGLFALDYNADDGSPRRALFTQFEAPDARRFFPGWDEPNFRTPYDLAVVVPAGQQAVSNMPEAGREARPDGSSVIRFQTSPAMSSYLLFLAVGEFDRITTTARGGTEIGVVTRRGAGEQGRFALESSARIVPWFNDYFGTPYPLPKLDNIAGPGSSQFFAAMENWGAIFSFENILLVDPTITTEARRQDIFKVAAHEISHQWFGNLVTMAWWDDLWLNEGFASWMATRATVSLHPEWEPLLDRVRIREEAMTPNSLSTTHAVVQRIQTVEQMSQAFDSITYDKGEAVITMLEDFVGDDAWRNGVRAYIARHRLGNTVTDDLWRSIEQAANRPITAIARDFLNQPGIPLIQVESARCVDGQTQVSFRQSRFSRDDRAAQSPVWRVPVVAAAGGREARTLIEGGAGQVAVPGCGPLVVNYGQAGYYRTLYAPELRARLTENFAGLRPLDQLGLIEDNWALGLAGYQSPAVALDMAAAAPADANSKVLERIAGVYAQVNGMLARDEARRARFARYANARLEPALDRIGWSPRATERPNDAILRGVLIGTLGATRDPIVVAEANRRFDANDPSVTSGPLRQTILGVVARNADAARWERLRVMARDERNPLVRVELYQLLGRAYDETLARRALELAMTPEPGATNSSQIIGSVAGAHPDLAFDFALANRERVEALVDVSSRSRFLSGLAAGSADPAMIDKLTAYAARYLTPQSRAPADRAIAAIRDRIRVRTERLPEITRWLEARPG